MNLLSLSRWSTPSQYFIRLLHSLHKPTVFLWAFDLPYKHFLASARLMITIARHVFIVIVSQQKLNESTISCSNSKTVVAAHHMVLLAPHSVGLDSSSSILSVTHDFASLQWGVSYQASGISPAFLLEFYWAYAQGEELSLFPYPDPCVDFCRCSNTAEGGVNV